MPVSVEITLDDLQRRLGQAGRGAAGLSLVVPFKRVRLLLIAAAKTNFDQGQGPDGAFWAPLRWPRPRGGNKPLRDRGLLMASLTGMGQGHVEKLTDTSLEIGSNLEYASLHQYGGTVVPRPPRRYLAIPLTVEAQRVGSARAFPGLTARIGKRGGVLKDRSGKVQFILTKRVVVPARPFLGVGLELASKMEDVLADWLQEAIQRRLMGG